MSCDRIRVDLVAFHFGTVNDDQRRTLEEHLLSCPGCLREFLSIKAEIETAAAIQRPCPEARNRLRKAVLREVLGQEEPRPWAWWERPLAFGFASAAVFAAVVAVQTLASSDGVPPHAIRNGAALPHDVPR